MKKHILKTGKRNLFGTIAVFLTVLFAAVPTLYVSAAPEETVLQSAIRYYRENIGSGFLYELRPESGNTLPYGESKYPGTNAYYPKGCGQARPEMYPWGSCTLSLTDDGFFKITPVSGGGDARITFDTSPREYYMTYDKPYFTIMLKTSKPYSGSISFRTLDGTCNKAFPVDFTGKWQKVILDFSDKNGWMTKDENGNFTVSAGNTPFSSAVNKLYGGHQMIFSSRDLTEYILIDYIAMFGTPSEAESFTGLAAEGALLPGEVDYEELERLKSIRMDSVDFYNRLRTENYIYELRPEYGYSIPEGPGRVNGSFCYYPQGTDMERPELYPWNSCTVSIEDEYFRITPKASSVSLTSDTSPRSYYMTYDKPYFTFVIKTSSIAPGGSFTLTTMDGSYRLVTKVPYSGTWQKVIVDLSAGGWEKKNADGEFVPCVETPFSEAVNKLYGGHNMKLAGLNSPDYYLFDYIAMFGSLEEAKAFDGYAEVEEGQTFVARSPHSIKNALAASPLILMKGYDDKTFRPGGSITRAEACTVLARMMGSESEIAEKRNTAFRDIPEDAWYYNAVTFLEELGVLVSFRGDFMPDKAITRAEFAELLYRADSFPEAGGQPGTAERTFTDVNAGTDYAEAIGAASRFGAVGGYGDGTFRPAGTITRAEAAAIICRVLGLEECFDKPRSFSDVPVDFWGYGYIMAISDVTLKTDTAAAAAKIAELDILTASRIAEIKSTPTSVSVRGTSYYVSAAGNDANDGRSPEKAWKTLDKVSSYPFADGDGVFFRRGDTFRGTLRTACGVTYSAYGEGEKPKICGSPEDGAVPGKWSCVDAEHAIWRYAEPMADQGTLIFNGGKTYAYKYIPNYKNGKFVYAWGEEFDISKHMTENLSLFCDVRGSGSAKPVRGVSTGYLYLRCDEGNPGEVFDSIEFMPDIHIISARSDNYTFTDNVFDNLCVLYGGAHGMHATTGERFTVQNCEFGFIGGGIQGYGLSANADTAATRFGNAVEVGFGHGHVIRNCYVHDIYDAGLTFQSGDGDGYNEDIVYEDNVIERCTYSVEIFMGRSKNASYDKYIRDLTVRNNIMRFAGEGFGSTRPDKSTAAHIKTWNNYNRVLDSSFVLEGNVFDRSTYMLIHAGVSAASELSSLPVMHGNTFIQYASRPGAGFCFGIYGDSVNRMPYDSAIAIRLDALGVPSPGDFCFLQ